MKKLILILAALTCACSWAGVTSARLGALGRNDMVVTNIGTIARAESYGTETQWTDATGCVWKVVDYGETWRVAYNSVGVKFVENPVWREPPDEMVPGWYAYGIEFGYQLASTNYNATLTDIKSYSGGIYDDVSGGMVYHTGYVSWMRGVQTILAGRVALTNDIPAIPAETDPTVPAWAKAQNKPTYTAVEVGATDGEAVTNIVRGMSLVGIWDDKLGVWWTPHMSGGAYYWTATTNVNLSAEGNQ